jgi:hypothetical protein
MTAVWPSTLPQRPVKGGWAGGPQDNRISFQPDVGESIDRRRASRVMEVREVQLPPLTGDELASFVAFYRDTLKDGVLAFQWRDAITGDAATFRFVRAEPPYASNIISPDSFSLSFRLLRVS